MSKFLRLMTNSDGATAIEYGLIAALIAVAAIAAMTSVGSKLGTNFNNALFDVRVASPDVRTADLPLYTFRNRTTGETRQLTDAGAGNITGRWSDLGRFKTPTLRALAARAPYFHNGTAATLEDVVLHYELSLGFSFSAGERADLVAFLNAL